MTKYKKLDAYTTLEIPVARIYMDTDFNCRGAIAPMSCLELSESMDEKGLKIPIIVQPRDDVSDLPDGFEYRVVAGHRRLTAARYLLRWEMIPATVVTGLTTEDAQVLNLVENLERKDLTLWQQAKALRRSFPPDMSYEDMAKKLNKTSKWVRIRWRLLDTTEEVQDLARKGLLKVDQLRVLAYSSEKEQRAMVAEIKTAATGRGSGKRRYKDKRLSGRRARPIREIDEMLTRITAEGRYPDPYKALAWAAGRLSDEELLQSDIDDE